MVEKLHFNLDVDRWQPGQEGDIDDATRYNLLRPFREVEKLQIYPCLLRDLALAIGLNGIALSRETLPELRKLTGWISRASERWLTSFSPGGGWREPWDNIFTNAGILPCRGSAVTEEDDEDNSGREGEGKERGARDEGEQGDSEMDMASVMTFDAAPSLILTMSIGCQVLGAD